MTADDLPDAERTEAARHDTPRRAASPTPGGEHDRSLRPVSDQKRARGRAGAGLARGRASDRSTVRDTGQPGGWPRYLPTPEEQARLAATLGAELRALRAEYGLSIRRLAERAAAHPTTVYRLEHGERRPRPSLLAALGYGLDPDRADELTARLIEAAGPSLRPDTPGGIRRRARRMERARRAARREAWRMERAAKDARSEGFHLLCRALRKLPIELAFEPDLSPGVLERAERLLDVITAAQRRADALLDAAEELSAVLARPRHPLEVPRSDRARRILDTLDAEQ